MAKERKSLGMPGWESTKASDSRASKLTEKQAAEIYVSTLGESKLAKGYGVSEWTIHGIRSGRRWRHVTAGLLSERNG